MPDLIKRLKKQFAANGVDNAKRCAEELMAHLLGCKPLEIYFRDVTAKQRAELETLAARVAGGEPLQYVIGSVDFCGLEIHCDPRALIPRPETELLVEGVLRSVLDIRRSTLSMADVGCGTGCIGLALLAECSQAEVTAIDRSAAALELACENAERLGLAERITFVQNDLLEGFEGGGFDAIVANLPYIATEVCAELDISVRDHEPVSALDGGADGLDLIRRLAAQASGILKPGGSLFLEIGCDQGSAARQILIDNGFRNVEIKKDLTRLDRIATGKKPPANI